MRVSWQTCVKGGVAAPRASGPMTSGRHHKGIAPIRCDGSQDDRPLASVGAEEACLVLRADKLCQSLSGPALQKSGNEIIAPFCSHDIHMVNGRIGCIPRKSSVEAVFRKIAVIRHGNEKTDFFRFVITYYISRVFSATNLRKFCFIGVQSQPLSSTLDCRRVNKARRQHGCRAR